MVRKILIIVDGFHRFHFPSYLHGVNRVPNAFNGHHRFFIDSSSTISVGNLPRPFRLWEAKANFCNERARILAFYWRFRCYRWSESRCPLIRSSCYRLSICYLRASLCSYNRCWSNWPLFPWERRERYKAPNIWATDETKFRRSETNGKWGQENKEGLS